MILQNVISLLSYLVSKRYFETIKIKNGEVYNLHYHQQRMQNTLKGVVYNLKELLEPPKEGLYRCRFLYDETGYEIEYLPYTKRIVKTLAIVHANTIEYSTKKIDRTVLDKLYSQKGGCDDVLIIKEGCVTDTTIANIALYDGAAWYTPDTPLLQGTMRQKLLDEGFLKEKRITFSALRDFKKMALMNAMIDFDIIAQDNLEDVLC